MRDYLFSSSLLWNPLYSSMLNGEKCYRQSWEFDFCAGLEAHFVTGKEGSLLYTPDRHALVYPVGFV